MKPVVSETRTDDPKPTCIRHNVTGGIDGVSRVHARKRNAQAAKVQPPELANGQAGRQIGERGANMRAIVVLGILAVAAVGPLDVIDDLLVDLHLADIILVNWVRGSSHVTVL